MTLRLLFPIGVLLTGESTKCWVRIEGGTQPAVQPAVRWRSITATGTRMPEAGEVVLDSFSTEGVDVEVTLEAPSVAGNYELSIGCSGSEDLTLLVTVIEKERKADYLWQCVEPLSYAWGVDRGIPVHRLHLEQFLARNSGDIRGRCLEFQEARYVTRFGGAAVRSVDILHMDAGNPRATLVGDLSQPNDLPGSRFDCIICTHVLQSIFHVGRAVSELHRMLAPGGVLLIGEPQLAMSDHRYAEMWRFTPAGLRRLLVEVFPPDLVDVQPFGNSLTAAGELRGLVSADHPEDVLEQHDGRFAAEICARAVKAG